MVYRIPEPTTCPTCGGEADVTDLDVCVVCTVAGCEDCIGEWRQQSIHNEDCS